MDGIESRVRDPEYKFKSDLMIILKQTKQSPIEFGERSSSGRYWKEGKGVLESYWNPPSIPLDIAFSCIDDIELQLVLL